MTNRTYKNPKTYLFQNKGRTGLSIQLRNRETLDFSGDWVDKCKHAKYIVIHAGEDVDGIVKLKGIEKFSNLEGLHIPAFMKLYGVDSISELKGLKNLYISARAEIKSLEWLKDLPVLESVTLRCNRVQSIESLRGNKNITSIELRNTDIIDISPLFTMDNLKSIDLTHSDKIDFGSFPFITQEDDDGIITYKNKHEVKLYMCKEQRDKLYFAQGKSLNKIPKDEQVIQL